MTDYKVQGKTLDHFILCIGPRTGLRPTISLTDLYVLVSRVRLGKNLYVIGFDPKTESNHLRRLKHSPVLRIWQAGYHGGRWDAPRAARFATKLAVQAAQEAKAKRQRSYVQSKRPAPNSDTAPAVNTVMQKTKQSRPNVQQGISKRDGETPGLAWQLVMCTFSPFTMQMGMLTCVYPKCFPLR